jgi:hypothetical protein
MSVQPPGYNPSESLLQGGTSTITPLMGGGGGLIETNPTESLLQGGNSANIIPLSGGAPSIDLLQETTNILPDYTDQLRPLIKDYIKKKLKLWALKPVRKQSSSSALPRYPIAQKKPPTNNYTEGVSIFDRFTCVLPDTMKTIVVFEPVNGNMNTYMKCIEYIDKKQYRNATNTVLIFSPPFFNTENPNKNAKILFSHFLKMKKESSALCFMLAEHTNGNIAAGHNFIQDQNDNNKYIINMLEPTYIVYPYPVNEHDGIIFSAATDSEVVVPISKVNTYMSIGNYILDNGAGCFACKPSIHKQDMIFDNYNKYRFIGKDSYILNNNVILIRLSVVNEHRDDINMFVGSKKAKNIDNIRDIELSTGMYKIRYPSETIRDDWWNGIFTDAEADLLNDLNLSTTMLEKVFGTYKWKTTLVEFLQSLVISNCYKDTSILEKSACNNTSKFVDKILVYYLMNDPNIMKRKMRETVSKEVLAAQPTVQETLTGASQPSLQKTLTEAIFEDTLDETTALNTLTKGTTTGNDADEPISTPATIVTVPIEPPKGTGNPFTDKAIQMVDSNSLSCEYYKTNKGQYKRQILAINTETDTTQWAEVIFNITEEEEIAGKLDSAFEYKLDEMRNRYPKWKFINITNEDCEPKPF